MTISNTETQIFSLEAAKKLRDEIIWQKISEIDLDVEINNWLSTFKEITQKNYLSAIRTLSNLKLIHPFSSLQAFSLVNHENIVDKIKSIPNAKETTKQARAGAYISLTRFLSRKYKGIITKAEPKKEGHPKTFYKIHDKVTTNAMSQSQWIKFFECLDKINTRDALIARLCLQGSKRIEEVLTLQLSAIDWNKSTIKFLHGKNETKKQVIITFSQEIMSMLQDITKNITSGLVFRTRTGKKLFLSQVDRTFSRAGKKAGVSFKVTPHVLRCSSITFLASQGFRCEEIAKVTGHASLEMVLAYDKSSLEENLSKKINLI